MPRPPRCRRIAHEPDITAFKPAGIPASALETFVLGLDELEALRLADLEGLYHDAAAARMGISRPTFGRLIARARATVAAALLQPGVLLIEGGCIEMSRHRVFECGSCEKRFEVPHGTGRPNCCPHCQGTDFHRAEEDRGRFGCGHGEADHGQGRCRRRHGGRGTGARAGTRTAAAVSPSTEAIPSTGEGE